MAFSFIENQPVLSRVIKKIKNTSNNSQSYLLVGNKKEKLELFSVLLSKVIICRKTYDKNCDKCNICKRIDNGNFGELKIIKPENGVIKKEKIKSVKEEFQTQPIEGKNQVYIINDIELLNKSSANSILKFLEEPESKTVAIFTTTNLNKVLDTIVSRCQIIKLNDDLKLGMEYVKQTTNLDEEKINLVMNFFFDMENNLVNSLVNEKKFINTFNTKELLKSSLLTIILLYKDALNYKLFKKMDYFNNETGIKNIAEKQESSIIIKKISFVLENIDKLDYNLNNLLFINNLLIGIGEIKYDKCNRN